jgi:hypothetical protein
MQDLPETEGPMGRRESFGGLLREYFRQAV